MSRTKHSVELCALLVDETYGELTSRIFTILLRRGRLPIRLLAQHTRLTARQLRHGLAVLVQQNLVYHHTDKDSDITYYEANDDAAYNLVRSGKVLDIVEERFGEQARDVVQNLLLLGHTKVADLVAAYDSIQKPLTNGRTNGHSNSNGDAHDTNGKAASNVIHTGQLHTILYQLLDSGFLEPVTAAMFISPTDTYNMVEREELQNNYGGSTKGVKQKDELKSTVMKRMQAIAEEGRKWRPMGTNKRGYNGDGANGASKRQKLSNSTTNGRIEYQDEGIRLDSDLVLRINYEKCNVSIRSHSLIKLASNRIGETTSQVYAELLRLIEPHVPRCRFGSRNDGENDETSQLPDSAAVSTAELSKEMSRTINVATGIGKASSDKIDMKRVNKAMARKARSGAAGSDDDGSSDGSESEEDDINGMHDVEDPFENGDDSLKHKSKGKSQSKVTFQTEPEDRQARMLQIRNHLMLLASDDYHFIRKHGLGQQGSYTVDFESLVQTLRETELDTLIMENFGKTGHRLGRIMRKFGKLDEKQLPKMALMKQKDVRTKLVEMQMAGFVDIQEVPKDNSRTAGRTIFLWHFDKQRVSTILLDIIYKAMSRCLQRLEVEKRQADDIITTVSRTDVRGNEEEMLTSEQMKKLREIRGKEEKLLAQVGRLDELVGIFRDF
ncbi:RNA polymerase III subunit RPC82 [Phlyctema vagabunda]|uniref:DNA-directed RNA polymerase III subunit RPC3 n=1 Tax=Phlyctema vagabunda TaxID=108571 RepID=A0ABR4P5U7_9HELO